MFGPNVVLDARPNVKVDLGMYLGSYLRWMEWLLREDRYGTGSDQSCKMLAHLKSKAIWHFCPRLPFNRRLSVQWQTRARQKFSNPALKWVSPILRLWISPNLQMKGKLPQVVLAHVGSSWHPFGSPWHPKIENVPIEKNIDLKTMLYTAVHCSDLPSSKTFASTLLGIFCKMGCFQNAWLGYFDCSFLYLYLGFKKALKKLRSSNGAAPLELAKFSSAVGFSVHYN